MTVQENHDQSKSLMSSEFLRRNDVIFSWGALQNFIMALPGFRSAWFGSNYDVNGDLRNINGIDPVLNANNTPDFGIDNQHAFVWFGGVAPYDYFNGTAAPYNISGVSTIVRTESRGLTIAGMINIDVLSSVIRYIFGKWGTVGTDYLIALNAANVLQFAINDTFAGITTFNFPAVSTGWNYFLAQWRASSNVYLQLNDESIDYAAAGITQITPSAQILTMGADNVAGYPFRGGVAWIALFDQYATAHRLLREVSLGGWPGQ